VPPTHRHETGHDPSKVWPMGARLDSNQGPTDYEDVKRPHPPLSPEPDSD